MELFLLYGWPRALIPSTFGSNYGAALRSVGWRPYKLVDSCSPANPQALNSQPVMDCSLEYCNRFGWYYRYLQIVKVPGPPNIFLPQLNKAPCTYCSPVSYELDRLHICSVSSACLHLPSRFSSQLRASVPDSRCPLLGFTSG